MVWRIPVRPDELCRKTSPQDCAAPNARPLPSRHWDGVVPARRPFGIQLGPDRVPMNSKTRPLPVNLLAGAVGLRDRIKAEIENSGEPQMDREFEHLRFSRQFIVLSRRQEHLFQRTCRLPTTEEDGQVEVLRSWLPPRRNGSDCLRLSSK